MALAFSIGLPSVRSSERIMVLPESRRLEQTWCVWNVSVTWITLNRDSDHGLAASQTRRGRRRFRGGISASVSDFRVAKLLFRIALRCAGAPFRPADLARGHSSPPPEVPR